MAIESRKRDVSVESTSPRWPYPYGTELYWFWAWGSTIKDMLERGFSPGECDWIVIKANSGANDAMMRYSIDYPAVVQEVRRWALEVENRWKEVLSNSSEDTREAYTNSLEVLSRRIMKACELIWEREKPCDGLDELPSEAHAAHAQKLFPLGEPADVDLKDAVVCLDTNREPGCSYSTILQCKKKISAEEANVMLKRIRTLRSQGRTTLPPQK